MAKRSDPMMRELPRWLSTTLILGTFAAVAVMELRRPLRKEREKKVRHGARNGVFAALSAATVALVEKPVTWPLAVAVHKNRWGALKLFRLPIWVDLTLSVLLLDYTLYLWHVLTHESSFLYRFHRPHHVDLDLDASTALRFHFGELVLSVPWRAAQVRLIGVSPLGLALWQTLTLVAIMFHHSNIRLPYEFERLLCRIVTTPRMHGIHHSIVKEETDSNWSTIFSWPDYLHGTIRLNVPQPGIDIGVAGYQDPAQVTLGKALAMPFVTPNPAACPEPKPLPIPRTILAP